MKIAAVICACNPPPVWREVANKLCHGPFSEVVVVDDGSSPPLAFQSPLEGKVPFRILRCQTNEGLAAARNRAMSSIQADWIFYVDADVVPSDAFLETLEARLGAGSADGFGFNVREHHRSSDWDFYRACERAAVKIDGEVEWVSGLLCAYRKGSLSAVNGFDPAFRSNGEDVDLGYRLTRAGKRLVQVPEICGEHFRKDSLQSFLRMHYRYALTAKRVDRARYFGQETPFANRPPLFRTGSIWPLLRLMLRFVGYRPWAFYLPPAILAAMFAGARTGRHQSYPPTHTPDGMNPALKSPQQPCA